MPYANKRALSKEKSNKECAKKCQKIDAFFNKAPNDARTRSGCEESSRVNPSFVEDDVMMPLPVTTQSDDNDAETAETADSEGENTGGSEHIDAEDMAVEQEGENVLEEPSDHNPTFLYRGFNLDLRFIIRKAGKDILSLFQEKERKKKTRTLARCLVCHEFEKKQESFPQIVDIIDHLHGASHAAAMEKRELVRKWAATDRSHPWVRTLQANDPGVVKSLIHMAVDVYNDSKLLTQSAWFWPSRSLAQLHAEE